MTSIQKPITDPSYVLKRDHLASSRLNLQFFLWKNSLQFNLHPDIPKLTAGTRVADVGTGTSIWLVDVARDSPKSVEFVGFDITLDQAPHQDFLPSNVKLRRWSFFEEPPADVAGTFDVVHVRLIMLVLKDHSAQEVILNLSKLLKPGGYLQWDEVDADGVYIEKINPAIQAPTMQMLFSTFSVPSDKLTEEGWKKDLVGTLKANGFPQSKAYHYRDDPSMARYWNDVYMVAWDEFIGKIMGHTESTQEAMNKAKVESHSGAAVMMPKTIWVARKSGGSHTVADEKAADCDSTTASFSANDFDQKQYLKDIPHRRSRFSRLLSKLGCHS